MQTDSVGWAVFKKRYDFKTAAAVVYHSLKTFSIFLVKTNVAGMENFTIISF